MRCGVVLADPQIGLDPNREISNFVSLAAVDRIRSRTKQ
jgi:hypothetical protein